MNVCFSTYCWVGVSMAWSDRGHYGHIPRLTDLLRKEAYFSLIVGFCCIKHCLCGETNNCSCFYVFSSHFWCVCQPGFSAKPTLSLRRVSFWGCSTMAFLETFVDLVPVAAQHSGLCWELWQFEPMWRKEKCIYSWNCSWKQRENSPPFISSTLKLCLPSFLHSYFSQI